MEGKQNTNGCLHASDGKYVEWQAACNDVHSYVYVYCLSLCTTAHTYETYQLSTCINHQQGSMHIDNGYYNKGYLSNICLNSSYSTSYDSQYC